MSEKLDVSASGKLSSVINLVLKDAVPERGEAIVNDVINVYNKVSITDKNQLAANTLDFVDKRLQNMGMQLDSVEIRYPEIQNRSECGGYQRTEQTIPGKCRGE